MGPLKYFNTGPSTCNSSRGTENWSHTTGHSVAVTANSFTVSLPPITGQSVIKLTFILEFLTL